MSFTDEFEGHYEVPGIIPFMLRKKLFEDMSWHNDSCPSFGVRRETGEEASHEVRLWTDHPFKSRRETGGDRFIVTVSKDDEQVFDYETDDLDSALETFFQKLGEWYRLGEPGVLAWLPDDMPGAWEDPLDILHDLKTEYLADPRA